MKKTANNMSQKQFKTIKYYLKKFRACKNKFLREIIK